MEVNLLETTPQDKPPKKTKCKKPNLLVFLQYIVIILIVIFLILVSILYYFSFAGILSLTISFLLYEWLSLFTKDVIHMFFSILSNFSDFGLFFILSLLCVYVIKTYFNFVKIGFKILLPIFQNRVPITDDTEDNSFFNCVLICNLILLCFVQVGLIALFIFVLSNQIRLFYASVSLECVFLILVFLGNICNLIKENREKSTKKHHSELSSSLVTPEYANINNNATNNTIIEEENENKTNENENKKNENENKKNESENENNDDKNLNNNNKRKSSLSIISDYIRRSSAMSITSNNPNSDIFDDDDSDFQQIKNENLLFVSFLNGMFDDSYKDANCSKCPRIYQGIIMAIIFVLQLYSLIYPCVTKMISIGHFFLYFFIKLIFIHKIFAFNLIDLMINGKRVIYSLKQLKAKVIYWIVVVLYILLFISFIVIFVLTRMTVFPTVKSATFNETNERWFKLGNNQTISPDGFCFTKAQKDGTLKTEDFAMLTTLPRMYDVTDDGKCFIKPSMRGLFNSTMKYIFGKNYENDRIFILCKKLTHYPILVLSSDKILNQTVDYFKDDKKIKFLNKQFDSINNTNYFDTFSMENVSEKTEKLMNEYEKCVSQKGTENCENEWDLFTQFYWSNEFNDSYEEIPGFERYQISIDSKLTIQPNFITNDGKLWAGTHYIISGSYEDSWGVGLFIETVGRKYTPYIFNNFLILYTFIRSISKEVFLRIEWFNRNVFYCDASSTKEMTSIAELYSQFNFSHQSLYTIGHSISGTAFKGVSFFTDIQGITFEASDGENNANLLINSHFKKNSVSVSQITNIYSKNTIFTGNDQTSDLNGILPKRYYLPSVYDTACMTAITCSETKKYVPFCRQVLTQNEKNPEKEFNISFTAFLNYYGYN